jgi:predicted PhzF superfamily epimerase YddE/YHI9
MRAEIHQIVTFADEVFKGNPAFVVSLPRGTPDETMQALAGQLGEPVLASLRPSDDGLTALHFHSPDGRHGGAGHAMMAAAHVGFEALPQRTSLTFVMADGSRRTIRREGRRISVPWPLMPGYAIEKRHELGAALGAMPLKTFEAAFGYVAVYDDADEVSSLKPDQDAVARLERGAVIATAQGKRSDFVLRVFAPKLGLPEDPVCGTAHRILVPYWAERLGRQALHSEQLSPRGGDLWCTLFADHVEISGHSLRFLSGAIELPDP